MGCVIGNGGGSCPDQWHPIGQPVKVYNLQGTGQDWRVLFLSGLSGCFDGAVATMESSPAGMLVGCLVGGGLEVGIDAGGQKLTGG